MVQVLSYTCIPRRLCIKIILFYIFIIIIKINYKKYDILFIFKITISKKFKTNLRD